MIALVENGFSAFFHEGPVKKTVARKVEVTKIVISEGDGAISIERKRHVNTQRLRISAAASILFALAAIPAVAQKKYDPGATDTEIKIGNIMPYTGVFSEYGATGRAEAAYFQMINDQGGINGRKITFVSLDLELGMLRPGIKITTSPTDYRPIKQLYLIKFDGADWTPLGDVIGD